MKKVFLVLIFMMYSTFSFAAENIVLGEGLLSTLTLREKIGQLCFVAAAIDEKIDHELIQFWSNWQPLYHLDRHYVEKMIKEQHVGGIVFYGKNAEPEQELALTKYFQSISKIPLLVTLDAELGLGSRLDPKNVMSFPYNMTLGAIHDQKLIYQTGFEVGKQLKMMGVHVNFAPVVDINSNPSNPVIGMRSFGSDKERVAVAGVAYMKGLQNAGIIACAKHFPGHGDTSVDSHVAIPRIDHTLEHLRDYELYPFQKMADAGVMSMMTAHLEIPALEKTPGLPSSLSRSIVTELLQTKMGFQGLIFTDALGMKAVADRFPPGEIELKALQAGNDVLICPVDVIKAIDYLENAVKQGTLSEDEINRKVLKVFKAKQWAFDKTKNANSANLDLKPESAQRLLRLLFRKAITCVKCEPHFLESLPNINAVIINTDPRLTAFEETIRKNTSYTFLPQPLDDPAWSNLNADIEKSSHIILSISGSTFGERVNTQLLSERISQLKANGKNVTLMMFCCPYTLSPAIEADNIILAYQATNEAQIAGAEVLSGQLIPEGILPISQD